MSPVTPVFELSISIGADDIDQLGHVNNVVYVRWIQEVAVAHWTALAPAAEQSRILWIVLRHEIDYKKPARMGDGIIARTWVGSATRLKFERFTEVVRAEDGALLAKARTLWCPVDRSSGKPAAVSQEVRACFSL